MDVPTILQKNVTKILERKYKKLLQLVIQTTDVRNVRLGNVLDVDLKITQLQDVQSHQKRMRNGKRK